MYLNCWSVVMMSGLKEIPGYFYDEEKKRYFRITEDYIAKKKKTTLLQENNLKVKKDNVSISQLLIKRSILGLSKDPLKELQQKNAFRGLKFNKQSYLPQLLPEDDYVKQIKVSHNGKYVLVAWNLKLNVYEVVYKHSKIQLREVEYEVLRGINQSYSFAWSPINPHHTIVCSSSGFFRQGVFQNTSMLTFNIRKDEVHLSSNVIPFPNKVISSCDFCSNEFYDKCITIGEERSNKVKLFDCSYSISYRTKSTYKMNSSPTVTKTFKQTPSQIVGLKSGNLAMLDYRMESVTGMIVSKDDQYCVDCLKIHKDENYVTMSNWNGSIYTMDLRMRRRVLSYRGHLNNYGKLEFLFDTDEKFLYAVGSDGTLRMWDVRSSHLQCCTQILTDANIQQIPAICYSEHWSGNARFPGLLVCHGDEFELFPGT